MNITDTVGDMLTRLRNATRARHSKVEMPGSRLKAEIARVLKEEGYIASFKMSEENRKKMLRITLKYGMDGRSAISTITRISTPGRRVYSSRADIPSVLGGLGDSVLTTPQGVMTGKKARKTGLGGEVLLEVS